MGVVHRSGCDFRRREGRKAVNVKAVKSSFAVVSQTYGSWRQTSYSDLQHLMLQANNGYLRTSQDGLPIGDGPVYESSSPTITFSPGDGLQAKFSTAIRAHMARDGKAQHVGVLELISGTSMVTAALAKELPGSTWVRLGLGQALSPAEGTLPPANVLELQGSLTSAGMPLLFHAPLLFQYLLALDLDASRVFARLFANEGDGGQQAGVADSTPEADGSIGGMSGQARGSAGGGGSSRGDAGGGAGMAPTSGGYWASGAEGGRREVAEASSLKLEEERRHLLQRLGQLLMSAKVSFLYAASVPGDVLATMVHQAASLVKASADVSMDPSGLCIVRMGSYTRFVGEHFGDDSHHSITRGGCLAWPAYRLEAPAPKRWSTHKIRVLRCNCPAELPSESEGAQLPMEARGRIAAYQLSRPSSLSSSSSSVVWSSTTSEPEKVSRHRVCAEGPELSLGPSSDIPLMMLHMFGLSTRDRARLTRSYNVLPASGHCEPWNLCVRGGALVWCELYVAGEMAKTSHAGTKDPHFGNRAQQKPAETWQPMEAFAALHPRSTFERLGVGMCASLHSAPGAPACCYRLYMMLLWECPRGFGKPSETRIFMAKYSDSWRRLIVYSEAYVGAVMRDKHGKRELKGPPSDEALRSLKGDESNEQSLSCISGIIARCVAGKSGLDEEARGSARKLSRKRLLVRDADLLPPTASWPFPSTHVVAPRESGATPFLPTASAVAAAADRVYSYQAQGGYQGVGVPGGAGPGESWGAGGHSYGMSARGETVTCRVYGPLGSKSDVVTEGSVAVTTLVSDLRDYCVHILHRKVLLFHAQVGTRPQRHRIGNHASGPTMDSLTPRRRDEAQGGEERDFFRDGATPGRDDADMELAAYGDDEGDAAPPREQYALRVIGLVEYLNTGDPTAQLGHYTATRACWEEGRTLKLQLELLGGWQPVALAANVRARVRWPLEMVAEDDEAGRCRARKEWPFSGDCLESWDLPGNFRVQVSNVSLLDPASISNFFNSPHYPAAPSPGVAAPPLTMCLGMSIHARSTFEEPLGGWCYSSSRPLSDLVTGAANWDEWVVFPCKWRDLPREARVHFVLFMDGGATPTPAAGPDGTGSPSAVPPGGTVRPAGAPHAYAYYGRHQHRRAFVEHGSLAGAKPPVLTKAKSASAARSKGTAMSKQMSANARLGSRPAPAPLAAVTRINARRPAVIRAMESANDDMRPSPATVYPAPPSASPRGVASPVISNAPQGEADSAGDSKDASTSMNKEAMVRLSVVKSMPLGSPPVAAAPITPQQRVTPPLLTDMSRLATQDMSRLLLRSIEQVHTLAPVNASTAGPSPAASGKLDEFQEELIEAVAWHAETGSVCPLGHTLGHSGSKTAPTSATARPASGSDGAGGGAGGGGEPAANSTCSYCLGERSDDDSCHPAPFPLPGSMASLASHSVSALLPPAGDRGVPLLPLAADPRTALEGAVPSIPDGSTFPVPSSPSGVGMGLGPPPAWESATWRPLSGSSPPLSPLSHASALSQPSSPSPSPPTEPLAGPAGGGGLGTWRCPSPLQLSHEQSSVTSRAASAVAAVTRETDSAASYVLSAPPACSPSPVHRKTEAVPMANQAACKPVPGQEQPGVADKLAVPGASNSLVRKSPTPTSEPGSGGPGDPGTHMHTREAAGSPQENSASVQQGFSADCKGLAPAAGRTGAPGSTGAYSPAHGKVANTPRVSMFGSGSFGSFGVQVSGEGLHLGRFVVDTSAELEPGMLSGMAADPSLTMDTSSVTSSCDLDDSDHSTSSDVSSPSPLTKGGGVNEGADAGGTPSSTGMLRRLKGDSTQPHMQHSSHDVAQAAGLVSPLGQGEQAQGGSPRGTGLQHAGGQLPPRQAALTGLGSPPRRDRSAFGLFEDDGVGDVDEGDKWPVGRRVLACGTVQVFDCEGFLACAGGLGLALHPPCATCCAREVGHEPLPDDAPDDANRLLLPPTVAGLRFKDYGKPVYFPLSPASLEWNRVNAGPAQALSCGPSGRPSEAQAGGHVPTRSPSIGLSRTATCSPSQDRASSEQFRNDLPAARQMPAPVASAEASKYRSRSSTEPLSMATLWRRMSREDTRAVTSQEEAGAHRMGGYPGQVHSLCSHRPHRLELVVSQFSCDVGGIRFCPGEPMTDLEAPKDGAREGEEPSAQPSPPAIASLTTPRMSLMHRTLGMDAGPTAFAHAHAFTPGVAVLSGRHRQGMWAQRNNPALRENPRMLPLVLRCCPPGDSTSAAEAHRLLAEWAPLCPLTAFCLLGPAVTDTLTRAYAVARVASMGDDELSDYLLQLVQALRHEHYHDSPLAHMLLTRALGSALVARVLFWHLLCELQVTRRRRTRCARHAASASIKAFEDRLWLLLQSLLRLAPRDVRRDLLSQAQLVELLRASRKTVAGAKRRSASQEQLRLWSALTKANLHCHQECTLPVSPRVAVRGVRVTESRVMSSKKRPLWLVMENADPLGPPVPILFKQGDDLRQDMLTLQMLRTMERLWLRCGMDLGVAPYHVVATGPSSGMIEVVQGETMANISKAAGGGHACFRGDTIARWLRRQNPTAAGYARAVDTFLRSCAAYSVATCVLGVGDRHNDNVMLHESGRLFHIDFGHFLGNFKSKFGVKRERARFVFTPDFAYVLGGVDDARFRQLERLCAKAFNVLRHNAHILVTLLQLMLPAGIPELRTDADINYLRESLLLGLSDEEAGAEFIKWIHESLNTFTTQLNNAIHTWVHK
eukprot:jgi/Mesvir1/17608/Mv08835-RA.1